MSEEKDTSYVEEQLETAEENGGSESGSGFSEEMRILEAVLFASNELMNAAKLKTIVPGQPDVRRIRKLVTDINDRLQKERHPFEIVEMAGGFQFRTVPYYHQWVRQLYKEKAPKKLSIQALECLAVIAYKQPISKAEIEAIRGVMSDGAVKTLLERHLITIAGRSDGPGRPLLYGTTQEFLTYFGINKVGDLPSIEEFEAIAREKAEDLTDEELEYIRETEAEEGEESPGDGEEVSEQAEETPDGLSEACGQPEQSVPESAESSEDDSGEQSEDHSEQVPEEAVSDSDIPESGEEEPEEPVSDSDIPEPEGEEETEETVSDSDVSEPEEEENPGNSAGEGDSEKRENS